MKKIKEFYKLAVTYCHYVLSNDISLENIAALMELLMMLYISAGNLPEAEPETIDPMLAEETGTAPIRFNENIPQLYWEVFDPFIYEDAVCASLVDDLSAIAADLQVGMKEFEAGRIGNAVFEWKFGFMTHWGHHLVDSLRALHKIRTL